MVEQALDKRCFKGSLGNNLTGVDVCCVALVVLSSF